MKLLLGGGLAMVVGLLVGLMIYVRTPYNTSQLRPIAQPVEFDHRHHVLDDEIDCLYCHWQAENSAYAGVPSTELCMGCHAQIWNDSPLLEPIRRSYFSGRPVQWVRVHKLPEFVFFDHSVHVQRGIGCVACHGRVDLMASVHQAAPLTMAWCLDCHRSPDERRADVPAVTSEQRTLWGGGREVLHPKPEGGRAVTRLTTCTACHR